MTTIFKTLIVALIVFLLAFMLAFGLVWVVGAVAAAHDGPEAAVAAAASAQEPAEFPPGWSCSPGGIIKDGVQTGEKPCHCKRMVYTEDCCPNPQEQSHDPTCSQYCHETNCGCPLQCATDEERKNHATVDPDDPMGGL